MMKWWSVPSAAPCSGSNLSAIHQRAMVLQGQCQEYLKKAEYALQTVSHDFHFFFFAKLFNGSVWVRAQMLHFISKEKASCCSFSVCGHGNSERMTEMLFRYKLSNWMRRLFMCNRQNAFMSNKVHFPWKMKLTHFVYLPGGPVFVTTPPWVVFKLSLNQRQFQIFGWVLQTHTRLHSFVLSNEWIISFSQNSSNLLE